MKVKGKEREMTYQEAIEYIHGLYWRGKKNGLEKTKELLELTGHPEQKLSFIHIAGTNGKGSTAVMLASILHRCGKKVGLYTSPYIMRYNERIRVNDRDISDNELATMTKKLAAFVEKMETPPSEFEFGTVLAMQYFAKKNCDIVILETGLGGTFDSTNVITDPLLCIITALGFDHTAILGNTMTEIAGAKAGIVKAGSRVVFYGDNEEGEKVIRKKCEELAVPLSMPDFEKIQNETGGEAVVVSQNHRRMLKGQEFSYKGYQKLTLALPGLYQLKNAALVLEAVEQLRLCGWEISEKAVRDGLSKVFWQARLEVLGEKPLVLVDGSHNPQGMQATLESLKAYFPGKKPVFVFGAMADKDLQTMIPMFLPMAKKVIVTAPNMPRAIKSEELLALCRNVSVKPEYVLTNSVSEAVSKAFCEPEEEIVVIIGSLYLAGEAKNYLEEAL